MTSKKAMTLLGLALGPIAVVSLDALFTRSGATGGIFETTREFVRSTGVAAWPVGVLIGHWYYPGERRPIVARPTNYIVLGIVSLVVMGGTVPFYWVAVASNFVATLTFVAGLFGGALLWAMGD
jgi:hypothetical protein